MIEKTGWSTRKRHDGRTEWLPPPTSTGGTTPVAGDGQRRINGYHHPERYLLPEDDQGP